MQLPKFVTFKEGNVFILQTRFPNYIGRVCKFSDDYGLWHYLHLSPPLAYQEILGYRILVAFAGTMEGNRVLAHGEMENEVAKLLEQMAEFYLLKRIMADEKRYLKYKVASRYGATTDTSE